MLSEWEGTDWAGSEPSKRLSVPDEDLATFASRLSPTSRLTRPWRIPSVRRAMGFPAIQRAVSLIASTTGMLSVQGYQNGSVLDKTPALIARPDPYSTPQSFYAGTASNMAKYGEFVWWIANDGPPAALVNVPLNELRVDANTANRLMPRYQWGKTVGTRYSGANPAGRFVHVMYPTAEPLSLRGEGPLQLCGAAASISVEAQEWAANFYAGGGDPSILIKHAGLLGAEADADGLNEAERLRSQFMEKDHNTPRIIDQTIESVEYLQPNQAGAQMLDARQHQNGDAARMFGLPGSLLEYQQSGSSLTYQNLEGEFTKFIRTCLQPLYLEPIEQALSDLMGRSFTARFNVKGFLRADIKTRFDVHKIAIDTGIYDAVYAQQEEGIIAGDVEYAPVPFAPPSVHVGPIVKVSSPLRCDGSVAKTIRGVRSIERCNALLSLDGAFVGRCRRCKKDWVAAA